jgi:hypothetical protein
MRVSRGLLWIPAVLITVALVTAPAEAAPPPVVPASTYVADVRAGAGALTRFGTILERTTDIDDLIARTPRARAALVVFDRRMYVLSRYRLADPALNRQRARLARTAPPVTAVLNLFLDAALTRDEERVQRLVPAVTRRITAFGAAAGAV